METLRRNMKHLMWATVALYAVLAFFALWVWLSGASQRTEIRRLALQSTTALCTIRFDLERRVENSKEFLREHPDGIPGITPRVIRDGIRDQEATIAALDILECPPKAPSVIP